MKKISFTLLIIFVFSSFAGCSTSSLSQSVQVKTAAASIGSIESTIEIAGAFAPNNTENVNSKLSGIVKEVTAVAGQTVHKGDMLLQLDTKDLEAQLAQAKASYNVAQDQAKIAKSNLEAAKKGVAIAKSSSSATHSLISDQEDQANINLDSAENNLYAVKEQNKHQLDQARISADTAQQNYINQQILYEIGEISDLDMQKAQDSLDSAMNQLKIAEASAYASQTAAEAKVDSARNAYEQAVGSSAKSQSAAAQGNLTSAQSKADTAEIQYESSSTSTLEQAQAAIDTITTQMENAKISSMIDGVVVSTNIHLGELAQPGATLVSIADISKLKLNGTISQENIPFVKAGQSVSVVADIYPDKEIEGAVTSIGPVSVSSGSYFPVEIVVNNDDQSLLAGISAHASIKVTKNDVLSVPISALLENDGKTFVFTIKDGIASKQEVSVGLKTKDVAEILKGLDSGTVIAINNVNTLVDQMPVSIQKD